MEKSARRAPLWGKLNKSGGGGAAAQELIQLFFSPYMKVFFNKPDTEVKNVNTGTASSRLAMKTEQI